MPDADEVPLTPRTPRRQAVPLLGTQGAADLYQQIVENLQLNVTFL